MTNGADGPELSFKIGKLVEEKGWNQEDFARISNLNRHTVRQILHGGPKRRLRNATVGFLKTLVTEGADVYQLSSLYPAGSFATGLYEFEFAGKQYQPAPGRS